MQPQNQMANLATNMMMIAVGFSILIVAILLGGGALLVGALTFGAFKGARDKPAGQVVSQIASRPFGAYPQAGWFDFYDHWLMVLDDVTGLKFSSTSTGNFIGSVLITIAPAFVIGLPLALLNILPWGMWVFWIPLAVLAVLGIYRGSTISQPSQMYSRTSQKAGESIAQAEEDEFEISLGEELQI